MHLFWPFVLFCFSHSSRLESLRQVVQTGHMLSWASRAKTSRFVNQHELGQVALFWGEIGRRVELLKFWINNTWLGPISDQLQVSQVLLPQSPARPLVQYADDIIHLSIRGHSIFPEKDVPDAWVTTANAPWSLLWNVEPARRLADLRLWKSIPVVSAEPGLRPDGSYYGERQRTRLSCRRSGYYSALHHPVSVAAAAARTRTRTHARWAVMYVSQIQIQPHDSPLPHPFSTFWSPTGGNGKR